MFGMPLLPFQSQSTSSIRVSTNLKEASTSQLQKRPATARIHAHSPAKRLRTDSGTVIAFAALDGWEVKPNFGDCPAYADHSGWAEDPSNNMVYMLGGVYPGDEDLIPTSDLYACDTRTMKWINLTDELRFRDPADPFGLVELSRKKQQLPRLGQPGLTLFRIHDSSFILIFGGYNLDENKSVSTLIAVDVDHREWWIVDVDGGAVSARINPVVVAVDHKIYIFGGDGKYSETDPQSLKSYSIASYQSDLRRWRWDARDVPYPGFIPAHQVFGAGIAVYNGKKIMLTPGKALCQNDPLNFAEEKIFYFHTEHRQFQMAPHLGDFPKNVLWYSIHYLPSPSSVHSRPASTSRRSARPPRRPSRLPGAAGITPPIASTSAPPSLGSVILCAWVPRPNSRYAVPELWRLSLSHNDEIRCLNKSQQIWDLNHDFQGCVAVGAQLVLLGNNNPKGEERWNIHLSVLLTAEDYEDKNTCI